MGVGKLRSFWKAYFQGRTISFREDTSGQCVFYNYTYKLTKPDCSPHVQFCCALSRWIETSTKKPESRLMVMYHDRKSSTKHMTLNKSTIPHLLLHPQEINIAPQK